MDTPNENARDDERRHIEIELEKAKLEKARAEVEKAKADARRAHNEATHEEVRIEKTKAEAGVAKTKRWADSSHALVAIGTLLLSAAAFWVKSKSED